jgi:hypothetical protein
MRQPSGMRLKPRPSDAPPRPAPPPRARSPQSLASSSRSLRPTAALAAALLASSMLAACATTGTSATTIKAQCAAWRAITYSSQHDTAVTVRQVRVHNRTGQKIGCWP